MSINKAKFSLSLMSEDKIIEYHDGCFFIPHNTEYKVLLHNSNPKRANAKIFIDGKEIGCFRINENETIILERPLHASRKLTFYDFNSEEAQTCNLNKIDSKFLGTIRVEIESELLMPIEKFEESCVLDSPNIGGTGLTRVSSQRFHKAALMRVDSESFITLEAEMNTKCNKNDPVVPL